MDQIMDHFSALFNIQRFMIIAEAHRLGILPDDDTYKDQIRYLMRVFCDDKNNNTKGGAL